MMKKTLFIAILLSLLGCVALAEPEATVEQDKDQVAAPAKHMQRIDQWSNELKAAYEAKDMDKIGQLIEQMDNFKARIRKAYAGKRLQDGENSGKDVKEARRAKFSKGDRENRGKNRNRMNQCQGNDMDHCRDNDMPRRGRRVWKENQYDDQYQCQSPYRQSAQRSDQNMRGRMRNWQGGRHNGGFAADDQFAGRRFACQGHCNMQRDFARRGQGMRGQRQQWQGQGRCNQGQGFASDMMDEGQMRPRHMRRQWSGQNQWQCPMEQRQGEFCGQRQMARGFGDNNQQQCQCPMYQQQRWDDRPRYQQKSRGNDDFEGQKFNRQGRNRNNQEVTPSGNEWEW